MNDFPIFPINNNFRSGTEYMVSNFNKKILPDLINIQNYVCLVLPGLYPPKEILPKDKKIIIWIHNPVSQFDSNLVDFIKYLINEDMVKKIIVVSNFHKQRLMNELDLEEDYFFICNNAIDPISFDFNKFKSNKIIKIIHAASAPRGTMDLVRGIKLLNEDNIRVDIYNEFNPDYNNELYESIKDERIFYHGRTPRRTVLNAFSTSHIYAYPCSITFEETFCLSQVESMSAGCFPVYSNMGALSEISMGYGNMYDLSNDLDNNDKIFAEQINLTIKNIKNQNINTVEQSKKINERFSWENAKKQWIELDNLL
jgi:glycosyltransferase involved in cell wall biosynthesis